jgi:hypothetical protein
MWQVYTRPTSASDFCFPVFLPPYTAPPAPFPTIERPQGFRFYPEEIKPIFVTNIKKIVQTF